MKKRIEEFEAVGVERDLAGLPMVKVPAGVVAGGPGFAAGEGGAGFPQDGAVDPP